MPYTVPDNHNGSPAGLKGKGKGKPSQKGKGKNTFEVNADNADWAWEQDVYQHDNDPEQIFGGGDIDEIRPWSVVVS